MRRAGLTAFIFFGFFIIAKGQQKRLDSLLAVNNAYHQLDSAKAIKLRDVFRACVLANDLARADIYLDSAILVASNLPYKNVLASVYFRIGSGFHYADRFRAITYYNKAIETAKVFGYPRIEAGAFLNLGSLYMDIGDYPKSLDAHEHALQLFNQVGDEGGVTSCYMNMSYIYVNMGQKVKGMEYTQKALSTFEKNAANRGMAVAYEAVVDLYFSASDAELSAMHVSPSNRLKEIQSALDKGFKKVFVTGEDDPSLVASYYSRYGKLYEATGNHSEAKKNYLKSLAVPGLGRSEESYPDDYISAGNFYIKKLNDFPSGVNMLHQALSSSRQYNKMDSEEFALKSLSEAYEKKGNFDSALFYFRQSIVVRDSIYSKEKEQEITRRQLKIDFDIKERDYKNAKQLADARLKEQAQQILVRNQQLQISDKEKTLQRLTFLTKQAEMENQKKLKEKELVQEQQKADYDKKIRDQQINVQGVQLAYNRRVSAFLGIMAAIIFATAMLIYNSRKRTIRLNKVVSEQKVELEELVKVKDKIFSIVSHDMRAPVNNIIAFSSLLEEGDIEQERLALYMEQIKGTLDHTSSLMENMLNWAASQMQGFTPVIENINISPMIAHGVNGITQPMLRKKIALTNNTADNIYVTGDKNMIELIIRNLFSNAVKFSRIGGDISLSVGKENGKVIISIHDNGVGMDAEKVAAINSKSSGSLKSTTGTDKEKGTGLGLMLCKHFANMMGGNIRVSSKPNESSTFNLILPAV